MIAAATHELPLVDLAERIRTRKTSSLDLTEAYLARIAKDAGRYNAFATVTADLARREARAADTAIRAGKYKGPLHGIPYGAKDLLDTAGITTAWGAAPTRTRVPKSDATVVRRLREAGAVLLGKLAMVEFAGGLGYRFPDASANGPGRNPWNTDRWTGGSSSGSGAAVAASLVGFAIGTETWGSILCPSAFCGITGLRPTYGRVSRAGGMVCSDSFDKIGPMAHGAADCRAILAAIAGPDDDDRTAADMPLDFVEAKPIPKGLRAAIVPLDFTKVGEPEVKRAFDEAVGELRALGVRAEVATLPDLPIADAAGAIITAEAISSFERFFRDGSVREMRDPYVPYQPEIAAAMTGADLVKAWRIREVAQRKMRDFFGRYDVILSPNFMSVAPPIDRDLYETLPYGDPVGAFGNACGLPALALPSGFGREKLPVGFQIMGPPWSEGLLLDLGEAYQKRTKHHLARA